MEDIQRQFDVPVIEEIKTFRDIFRLLLEKFFHELLAAAGDYNRIGSYWERGHQNAIDLVAINDMKKTITIADIKLNRSKLNEKGLKYRAQRLLTSYPLHHPKWLGLSVENMEDEIEDRRRGWRSVLAEGHRQPLSSPALVHRKIGSIGLR